MSVSQAISAQVPYLRRFARALTGNQQGGDAYVLAALESIVAEPGSIKEGPELRANLYRIFLKVWESMPMNGHVDRSGSGEEAGVQRNLDAISLRPRIAFLLSALEGFSNSEIAVALSVPEGDIASLIDKAGSEIADQIRTDVLIIEDEPFIALDLQQLVGDLGHNIVGIARTHSEAIDLVSKGRPGLILADIQLADGSSGLEAVNQILEAFSVPVIFVTAYPERFLTGAPPEPAFLVTKPFSVESLKAVISQALFFDRRSHRKSEAGTLATAR